MEQLINIINKEVLTTGYKVVKAPPLPTSITLLRGSDTAWTSIMNHCPAEKQLMVPLNSNQMGSRLLWFLHEQFHQHSTPTPSHLLLHPSPGGNHMQLPSIHLLKHTTVGTKTIKFGWSTDFHCSSVHSLCFSSYYWTPSIVYLQKWDRECLSPTVLQQLMMMCLLLEL